MIPSLKLKQDASEEKTIHDDAIVLVGCMKSLSDLGWSRRFCRALFSPCPKKLSTSMSAMW